MKKNTAAERARRRYAQAHPDPIRDVYYGPDAIETVTAAHPAEARKIARMTRAIGAPQPEEEK